MPIVGSKERGLLTIEVTFELTQPMYYIVPQRCSQTGGRTDTITIAIPRFTLGAL